MCVCVCVPLSVTAAAFTSNLTARLSVVRPGATHTKTRLEMALHRDPFSAAVMFGHWCQSTW